MRLTIVQSAIEWENPAANRAMFAAKLAPLAGATDLVVLPEMFSTGFSMNAAAMAEPADGPTFHWMRDQAARLNAAITGSYICSDNGRFYNRLLWVYPDGRFETYNKRHLFTLAHEHQTYTAGTDRLELEWLGWRICPLICYDLRFPVWARNRPAQPYDLLIYVANWPSRRAHHWRTLLPARAIENQAVVIGVNIFGHDGNGLEYSGDSAIIDHSGQTICCISGSEGIFTTELSLENIRNYRQQLPFLNDADPFTVQ